jgi:hypothetical protein
MRRPSFIPTAQEREAAREVRAQQKQLRQEEYAEHCQRIAAAAGVSSFVLRCHQDVWLEILGMLKGRVDFRRPADSAVKDLGDGLVEVTLSGPAMLGVLNGMWHSSHGLVTPGLVARNILATRIYQASIAVVNQVDPSAPGRALPPIVLDDKAATDPPS